MVRALAILVLVTLSGTAGAEERAAADAASEASCGAQQVDAAAAAAAEEQAFAAELERFAQRRGFTERLMAKREAEAFERAALREARAAKLKRELTEREAALMQREFDEAVALYLKKRELTRALAASRAKAAAADSANVPSPLP